MKYDNEIKVEFLSKSTNLSFARMVISAFISSLEPTEDEITDITTAVSEAVDNAILHAYEDELGKISIKAQSKDKMISIQIKDYGKGIEDITKAKEPLYTSNSDFERCSGMGFTIMESFMDKLTVKSKVGMGTTVILCKKLS